MLKLITGLLSGVWGYVAAAVLAASLASGATYYIVHNANASEIATLKLEQVQAHDASITASLNQLTGFISTMHAAADGYQNTLNGINQDFADIKKGLSNAVSKTPLPNDCRPDPGRLSILTAAVDAANKTAAP